MRGAATLALLALLGLAAARTATAYAGVQILIQFDDALDRVQGNIKAVNKYVATELCKIKEGEAFVVSAKDESTTFDQQSKAVFFCRGDPNAIIKACGSSWNQHQLKDELEDHTSPDVEVDKVLQCGPAVEYTPGSGRAPQPLAQKAAAARPAGRRHLLRA